MHDWSDFKELTESEQAHFLLGVARRALPHLAVNPEVQGKVADYVETCAAVLGGEVARHAHLMRFLDDPQMTDDFNVYTIDLEPDENALSALDIAAYACGFTARMMAEAAGDPPLPDPVRECVPDIADDYRERAKGLGL